METGYYSYLCDYVVMETGYYSYLCDYVVMETGPVTMVTIFSYLCDYVVVETGYYSYLRDYVVMETGHHLMKDVFLEVSVARFSMNLYDQHTAKPGEKKHSSASNIHKRKDI